MAKTIYDSYGDYQERLAASRKAAYIRAQAEREAAWVQNAVEHERIRREMMRSQQEITDREYNDADAYGTATRKEDREMVTIRDTKAQNSRKSATNEELQKEVRDLSLAREGNRIVVPEDMPLETAIEFLHAKIKEGEKKIEIEYSFQLMVPEGALALFNTLNDLYGFVKLMDTPGFFGPEPPTLLTVEVSKDHTQMIPWGRFSVPGVPGFIETSIKWTSKIPFFHLKATIPAGAKMEIQRIVDHMKARTDSIYKGAAIKVRFPSEEKGVRIHDFFPRFMDLANISEDQLIFSLPVANIVDMTVFTPIRKTAFCREHGISLKRGTLLEGPPGVGKTLTASVTATLAQKHGWTFIQCDDVHDLPRVYKFAMHHQPAVIFCEDLDAVLKETDVRNDVVNNILNSIDGIESKDLEILLVLTTNFVGRITKASLRPGRIDAVVPVRPPDAEAVQRLIRLYAKDTMRPMENLEVAGQILAGKNAAVVREVVERSKLSAIRRLTEPGQAINIKADDIEVAAHGMEAHNKLLEPEVEDKRSDLEKAAALLVEGFLPALSRAGGKASNGTGPYTLEELNELVAGIAARERERLPVGVQTFTSPSADDPEPGLPQGMTLPPLPPLSHY